MRKETDLLERDRDQSESRKGTHFAFASLLLNRYSTDFLVGCVVVVEFLLYPAPTEINTHLSDLNSMRKLKHKGGSGF